LQALESESRFINMDVNVDDDSPCLAAAKAVESEPDDVGGVSDEAQEGCE
jgi:hypothetical protein